MNPSLSKIKKYLEKEEYFFSHLKIQPTFDKKLIQLIESSKYSRFHLSRVGCILIKYSKPISIYVLGWLIHVIVFMALAKFYVFIRLFKINYKQKRWLVNIQTVKGLKQLSELYNISKNKNLAQNPFNKAGLKMNYKKFAS